MPKDYAKKSQKAKAATRGGSSKKRKMPKQSNTTSSNWMLVCFLIVLIAGGMFFIKEHHVQALKHRMLVALQTKPHEQASAQNKSAGVQYDFYTILPKQKVWVPDDNQKNSDEKNTSTASTASSAAVSVPTAPITATPPLKKVSKPEIYILQVAAFQKYQPADDLKAKLILEGYAVHVDPKPVNGWTRVWLGPFKNLKDAEHMQIKVATSDKIKGVVNEMPVS